MKKIMTSLFALAAVFCASAAVPTYTVNPASETELASKTQEIVFTFSEPVRVDSVDFVGGQRFNAVTTRVATGMTDPSTTVTVNAVDAYWGEANGGEFLLEVYLPAIYNAAGAQIMDNGTDPDTGEDYSYPFTAVAYYTTPDATPAEFLRYEPASDEMTVWDVYMDGWGSVIFVFSGEVQMTDEDEAAYVDYETTDGSIISYTLSSNDVWGDWDMWTGEYNLSVMLPADSTLTQANLQSIEVELNGISANGQSISIPIASYDLMTLPTKALQKSNGANNGTASVSLNLSNNEVVNVYNLQGNLVAKGIPAAKITTLGKGLYVVNGKKFLVK